MRILVTTGIFPNPADPTRGIYIYKQVEALMRRCEVRVIAPVPSYGLGLLNGGNAVPLESEHDGVRALHPRYPVVPGLRALHGPSVAVSTFSCHRRVARQLRPDVILSFFAYPYGFAAAAIGKRLDIPVFIGALGSDVNVKARRSVEGPMIRWSLRRAERVLSVSHALDQAIGDMGIDERRRVVVPNGIDGERFVPMPRNEARARLGLPYEGEMMCCVSRLSHEKGIDILLRALARMTRDSTRLIVVGDGGERAALDRLARDLGVSERVSFVGARAHNEVPLWISSADVSVLPSRIEGHPNAVLEAMACGRPVVAARVGGVPETIRSESVGTLVDGEDPEGLARALDDALGREWDTDAIAAIGGARTWDHVAGEIMDLVTSLGGRAV